MPPRPDVSAERRAQIIEAALSCFTRKGYNNTTMDDIATESSLSKGSLYWYFKSKDDLFESAIEWFFGGLDEEFDAALGQYASVSGKLRALVEQMARLSRSADGLFSLFVEFWVSSPQREEAGRLWTGMLERYKDVIVGLIEEGVANGEFRLMDAESLAWAIMAAYDGLAAYIMLMPHLDVDSVSQAFVEALLGGLILPGAKQGER